MNNIQEIVDRAVQLATKAAMSGKPLSRVVWLPPATLAQDYMGTFILQDCGSLSAMDSMPWD